MAKARFSVGDVQKGGESWRLLTMYQDEKNLPAVPSRSSQAPLVESVSQLCSPQTANSSQTEARWEIVNANSSLCLGPFFQ